ncbi:hypothetical protein D9613_010310 [Agrocybe pediades]|uniref:Ras-domain-containing protein n=1 Tax=Agrocybe pediades TaxID=84607 RepID=A0A8H4QF71_9AGAR|nr:hypothetical protein D9613_010310 [Agrocybe pediades]
MPTVKLVVIGSSGVGKTSLRGKYISGRFSSGYRATIGADFITKTLPHPTKPDESVTLQIWDTAGQERFSSLSSAFFRGADAALLMFDVNQPETMSALKKWWADFCDKTPVSSDADMNDYCCVVVGNKIDMAGKDGMVSQSEALEFLDELVPPPSSNLSSAGDVLPSTPTNGILQRNGTDIPTPNSSISSQSTPSSSSLPIPRSSAIAIQNGSGSTSRSPRTGLSKSRSRSSSRFYPGTMTTTHTVMTIYHTPSSSMFDLYESARSSPEPPLSPPGSVRKRSMTILSSNSASSGSAATITPSLFAREREMLSVNGSPPPLASSSGSPLLGSSSNYPPLPPERGPKLFFTSAKTGEGVTDVFEYIAKRVIRKWEYEEWVEARTMHYRDASGAADTIRLQADGRGRKWSNCC